MATAPTSQGGTPGGAEGVTNVTLTVRRPGRPELGITLDTADTYGCTQDVFAPANHFGFKLGVARPTGRPLTTQYCSILRAMCWPDTVVGLSIQAGGDPVPAGTAIIEDQWVGNESERSEEYITISGRDATALLLDNVCDTELGSLVANGGTVATILDALLKPYRGKGLPLQVIVGNDGNRKAMTGAQRPWAGQGPSNTIQLATRIASVGAAGPTDDFVRMPIKEAKPHAGEYEWAFMQRHCANVGCLLWADEGGNLVLATPNYQQAPSYSLRRYLGAAATKNNVLYGGVRRTTQGVMTSVKLLGHAQGRGVLREQVTHTETLDPAAYTAALRADGQDVSGLGGAVYWPRRHVMHDSHAEDHARAKRVARRALGRACAKLVACEYTVAGHAQNGRVYAVDTMVDVDDELGGVRGLFWVCHVHHQGARGKRTTTLRMIPKGALVL